MKKFIIYLSFLSLSFILILNYFMINSIKSVTGTTIKNTSYTNHITVSGEFISTDSENIMFSYPIYIKEVFVTANSNVTKNQALFSIDKEKMINMLEMYDTTGESEYSIQEINLLQEIVYASKDGIVGSLFYEEDDLVMPNSTILTISKHSDIMAKFTVNQSDFGKISIGDKVYITSIAFSDIKYEGEISDETAVIYEEVNALGSKVMIDIFADVYNLDNKSADGLQITARIESENIENINILEYEYINQDENGEFVYIIDNGNAKKAYIISGVETEIGQEILNDFPKDTIFIKGDIKEFDKVVLSNATKD